MHSRDTPVVKVKGAEHRPAVGIDRRAVDRLFRPGLVEFSADFADGAAIGCHSGKFCRISEEAAGRLQDISGKVVASEANVNSGSEALKLQIKQLESQLLEQSKQQHGVAGQATDWTSAWPR